MNLAHGHEGKGLKWRYVAHYKLYGVMKRVAKVAIKFCELHCEAQRVPSTEVTAFLGSKRAGEYGTKAFAPDRIPSISIIIQCMNFTRYLCTFVPALKDAVLLEARHKYSTLTNHVRCQKYLLSFVLCDDGSRGE